MRKCRPEKFRHFSRSEIFEPYLVGNKATGQISKRVLQEKKPNFPTSKYFLPPDKHTHVCVLGGKASPFFGKFDVLYFLVTPALRLAVLPY